MANRTPLSLLSRSCGECAECCTVIGVKELKKHHYEACKHIHNGKCGVYDRRPPSCRSYMCFWLAGEFSWDDRPDKLGVLFQVDEDVHGLWIEVYETRPGAWNDKALELAKALVFPDIRGIRVIKYGQHVGVTWGKTNGRTFVSRDNFLYFLESHEIAHRVRNESVATSPIVPRPDDAVQLEGGDCVPD